MHAYKAFEVDPRYADELNVILRCPDKKCAHIFSPGPSSDEMRIGLLALAEAYTHE